MIKFTNSSTFLDAKVDLLHGIGPEEKQRNCALLYGSQNNASANGQWGLTPCYDHEEIETKDKFIPICEKDIS